MDEKKDKAIKDIKNCSEVLAWNEPLKVYIKITKKEAINAIKSSPIPDITKNARMVGFNFYIG